MSFMLPLVSSKLTWGTTEFLITFGDSYTTDGFNISAGVNSPVPGFVSAIVLPIPPQIYGHDYRRPPMVPTG